MKPSKEQPRLPGIDPEQDDRERRARVWLWLAWMAMREEDSILYADDIRERERRSSELDDLAKTRKACLRKADRVAGRGYAARAWRGAIDEFLNAKI